jgi:hypothetical protein
VYVPKIVFPRYRECRTAFHEKFGKVQGAMVSDYVCQELSEMGFSNDQKLMSPTVPFAEYFLKVLFALGGEVAEMHFSKNAQLTCAQMRAENREIINGHHIWVRFMGQKQALKEFIQY